MPEEDKTYEDYFEEALSQDSGKAAEDHDMGLDKGASGDDTDEQATQEGDEKSQREQEEEEGKSVFRRVPDDDDNEDDDTSDEDNSQDDSTDYRSLYEQTKAKLDEVQEALKKEQHKTSSWEGRISKANQAKKAAEEKAAKLQAENDELKKQGSGSGEGDGEDALTRNLSENDREMLQEFQSDFPDFVEPMKTIAAAMAKSALAETGNTSLTEDAESGDTTEHQDTDQGDGSGSNDQETQEALVKEHERKLTEAHPDWKEIAQGGKLKKWIDGQEFWVRRQLLEIANKGTAEEVIEMITEYKKAQGIETVNESGKGSGNKNFKNSGGKNSEAESFMAVEGSPSSGPSGKDKKSKDDFDGGWEEATS